MREDYADQDKLSNLICIGFLSVLIVLIFLLAAKLFGEEFGYFFKWWLALTGLGLVFLPLSCLIFPSFKDLGWGFSKTIGLAVGGWLTWYLASIKLVSFSTLTSYICIFICLVANAALYWFVLRKKSTISFSLKHLSHILFAELIFLTLFVLWLYIKGFQPQAYGTTEKLMDFGFMKAMSKSDHMPPEDLWLAGMPINYYYMGQFLATFLSRLSGLDVEYGYNFMLMTIAAMAFSLPASIIFNAGSDHIRSIGEESKLTGKIFPYLAAALSGIMIAFNSNLHYPIYARFIPFVRSLLGIDKLAEASGYSFHNYFFPDSTRFIGYDPDTADKTIHEFPLYSFVLGDLHAHVINIIFVLTVVAILYSYIQCRRSALKEAQLNNSYADLSSDFLSQVLAPQVLLIGFFIGLFHTSNYWDYPIYFVVSGAILLFTNSIVYDFSKQTIKLTLYHALTVLAISALVCLPFTISFNKISSSIRLAENHSPFYQLLILWGLPLLLVLAFLFTTIKDLGVKKSSGKYKSFIFNYISSLEPSDLFIITLGLCAAGLVLLPELIYVKDIYSGDYKRANTMFKLTYQAFILFGLAGGYIIAKLLLIKTSARRRIFAIIGLILVILSTGYFDNSVKAWFGFDFISTSGYKGLDCGEYLLNVNEEDYYACEWINKHIEGRPVILEVNGPSYTDYNRVSVRTGLPTVLGWNTHEWLWQSSSSTGYPAILNERSSDIEAIYTSTDIEEVKELIAKYNISYIYVGDLERGKYSESVNYNLLNSLGQVVYPAHFEVGQEETTTYIIKITP